MTDLNELIQVVQQNQESVMTLGVLGTVGLGLTLIGDNGKQKLASGRWAGPKEFKAVRKTALKQFTDRKRNAVTLYIGQPQALGKATRAVRNQAPPELFMDPKTLYVPDAQRGIATIGGPGSGKTYTVIDPMMRSAVDQGYPIILYDFKYPAQSERLAGYAALAGYEINIFAPGFPESDVCNPLDFLRSPSDAEMARQMGEVMNRNFGAAGGKGEDPFFGPAGDQLTEALFMLVKGSKYPDIMMAQAILSLSSLALRLEGATLDPWVRSSFGQLLSVKDSEKTVASIVATANNVFSRFIKQGVLGAFCGQTTMPLDLEGKQLLIFGMDRERRDVVGPLLATILHLVVTRNVVVKRKDPLIVGIDEFPTLYLPQICKWLNECREDGFVGLLGFQNMAQIEKTYGREISKAILGGCGTKVLFNPQEFDSAKTLSEFLGDEEIRSKQKSRSSGGGKATTSLADQERTRKLWEPSQFLKMQTGKCIVINPAYTDGKESYVPLIRQVVIPKADLEAMGRSQEAWEEIRPKLIARSKQRLPSTSDLQKRFREAEAMLPEPITE